ncbi:MAG: tRNA (adenosine(37)-N6)-threonylcarbamoyltransferase complex transferase subunit TsaD [Bacteroidales bacterium]|nr:tRNA (adenosine(37)-N6)-threonylcarbamoyltransferase complex transferase subunit TsaD [Bacteroidales bacterium]
MKKTILGIESSCDDTSAAVIQDGFLLSNIIANQDIHKKYGGVVPELASRAHQQNIVPVVRAAIKEAKINEKEISAIAFTRGPGLLGSLLVGTSFAKGLALSLNIPIIEVNHLQAHVLSHFIKIKNKQNEEPKFPFLCLLVSGGHSQILLVRDFLNMEVLGNTIDDAAGEAFDKCAKIIGLEYPGGPLIDKLAKSGIEDRFVFSKPKIKGFDYSFSGLKTSFLYFIRDEIEKNKDFIEQNKADLCASVQKTIIDILLDKLMLAQKETGIMDIAIAGGVSANSGLRDRLKFEAKNRNWNLFIPAFEFTTDNAAMIAINGYHKLLKNDFASQSITPLARFNNGI